MGEVFYLCLVLDLTVVGLILIRLSHMFTFLPYLPVGVAFGHDEVGRDGGDSH